MIVLRTSSSQERDAANQSSLIILLKQKLQDNGQEWEWRESFLPGYFGVIALK